MSDILRPMVGDFVKLYKWENESNPDINKQRIYVGQVVSSKFVAPRAEVHLDIKFIRETITDVLASTVKPIQDPYFNVGDCVCVVHPIGNDKFLKFGTIIKREIDTTLPNSLPMYDIRTIDGHFYRGVAETDLSHLSLASWLTAWKEWQYSRISNAWINRDKELSYKFLKNDSTNKKENNMPTASDLLTSVSSSLTCTGSITNSYSTLIKPDYLGISAKVFTCDELPSVDTKKNEKKEEKKTVYIPHAYRVKRIIYNDPATIVFWDDGTKTVVKRGEKETFNKYTAFCAALAKKMYGNNSQVNKIVNSGLDETKKRVQKSDTKKVEKKKPVKREIYVNLANSDENWNNLIRKVTTRFTNQDIPEKMVPSYVSAIKTYYELNQTIRDIALHLGVSESCVKATLKDMREILGR